MKVPTGPASFSLRTGAPIIPTFLVREPDNSYCLIFEEAIHCPVGMDREEAVRAVTQTCLEVMERTIRRYPTQWYMFHQEFWKPGPAIVL